eukprot:c43243_g1_i1 orf=17-247(-)
MIFLSSCTIPILNKSSLSPFLSFVHYLMKQMAVQSYVFLPGVSKRFASVLHLSSPSLDVPHSFFGVSLDSQSSMVA